VESWGTIALKGRILEKFHSRASTSMGTRLAVADVGFAGVSHKAVWTYAFVRNLSVDALASILTNLLTGAVLVCHIAEIDERAARVATV
jgi:hypothetical protein